MNFVGVPQFNHQICQIKERTVKKGSFHFFHVNTKKIQNVRIYMTIHFFASIFTHQLTYSVSGQKQDFNILKKQNSNPTFLKILRKPAVEVFIYIIELKN